MKQLELGIKIAELRIQNSMTQKELADLCNVDIRTIQRIESGEVTPRMHTLKLLSTALGFELSHFNGRSEGDQKGLSRKIKLSFVAGIIFSINVIPVVFYLITKSLAPFIHILTMIIYMASSIVFFKGFYLLGRKSGNMILTVSSLITVVLLPFVNLTELLRTYLLKSVYHPSLSISSTIFTLLCLNAIIFGIGLFTEANKKKSLRRINLYAVTGLITIIQSVLFLSLNFPLVSIGLVISIGTDVLLTIILYKEYKNPGKGYVNSLPDVSLVW